MIGKPKINQKKLLAEMYELYEQKMYSVAYSILHSVQQSEDAVQESFLKIIKYLPKIDKADSIKTKSLIIQILKTTAIDQYRKNNKDKDRLTEEDVADSDINTNIVLMQSVEEQAFIHNILNELDKDYLDVIKLRCYYGFSSRETADILSISEANVCKRLERAKKQILNKLEEENLGYGKKGFESNFDECWERNARRTV